ncbi:AAA family ATPase [Candidatus Dependentiae bacterium]|nr:AAA family ATPase [Candidatus Dependentiae bacterium]
MKELPIGISTFPEIIQKGYLYVDKTAIIYSIVSRKKYYFLNRPRRFGKSLLVSTIEAIFTANRELFAGLAIDSLPYDWQKHPVISISFSGIPYTTPELLEDGIKRYLKDIAAEHQIVLQKGTAGEMLKELVKTLAISTTVVLLVDEYDYPILQHIHDKETAKAIRGILKSFYGFIKDLDKYLRFVFFTGVSKFSNTSLFSGLNNLEDIGLDIESNTLLGYTSAEVAHYFHEHVVHMAHKIGCSKERLLEDIKTWYDGYQFALERHATKVYNPFSVMLCLTKGRFSNYWFQTGTPSFLMTLLEEKSYPIEEFEHMEVTENNLGAFDIDAIPLGVVLFQAGYLTIQGYNQETGNYVLTYPNKETIDSLIENVFASMTSKPEAYLNSIVSALRRAFKECDFKQIQTILTQLYAHVPYTIHIGEEKYYQTIFYLAFKLTGAVIAVEQPTHDGRIDVVLETLGAYFIIEMKINAPAIKALEQIKYKKYYQPYESKGKKIILVGIAFDTTRKNISELEYEELPMQKK